MSGAVPETRYAKTLDGGFIAYKILGGGAIDVAIVGSIATNIEVFMDYEPAARSWFDLASSARVTLHDRRGTGLSDDMGGLPNLETRAAGLLAVLDAAGQERPVLLASGDGGMVGSLLAASPPLPPESEPQLPQLISGISAPVETTERPLRLLSA
jgi:pimeloyl-ACP methyl ester carboxylesterase